MIFKPPPLSSISIPDLVQGIHALVVPFFIFSGLLYLLFAYFQIWNLALAGVIIITWLLIYGLIACLQKCRKINAGINDGELLIKCRTNLLIGTGLGLFVAWIPRLVIYPAAGFFSWGVGVYLPFGLGYNWLNIQEMILWYTIFLAIPTIPLLWTQFIWPSKRHCRVVYDKKEKGPWIILGINVFLLLLSTKLGVLFSWSSRDNVVWTQVAFSAICTACMIEFVQVWKGKVKLVYPDQESSGNVPFLEKLSGFLNPNHLENGVQEEKPVVAKNLGESVLRFQCENCHEDYSNPSKTPRMLKECGHTICEKCADNLLNNGQHLFCPFCQKVTVVNGKANLLPKNFTVLEMMDEQKNIYQV